MKNENKFVAVISLIAGICFIVSALIGKNYVFIPIGSCFIVLSIVFGKKDSGSSEEK